MADHLDVDHIHAVTIKPSDSRETILEALCIQKIDKVRYSYKGPFYPLPDELVRWWCQYWGGKSTLRSSTVVSEGEFFQSPIIETISGVAYICTI